MEARVGIGLSHQFRCLNNRINPCKIKDYSPLLARIVHYFSIRSLTVSLTVVGHNVAFLTPQILEV